MNKIKYYITHFNEFLGAIFIKFHGLFPNDELYLKTIFRCFMKQKLNLNNPQTYNEKLQWLKLYNRKPEYTMMVDKLEVKTYVADRIGEEYVIPTLAVWNRVEDINIDNLPSQFVLKTTHAGGGNGVVICKDKTTFDLDNAKQKLSRSMRQNPYNTLREWPYKNVKHRIIAEQYMVDESGYELKDYKWFCFDGEPKGLFVATDRGSDQEETKFDFFDAEYNHLPLTNGHPNAYTDIPRPKGFETMKRLAALLSMGQPHVRVDLYDINGKIYFGELTFYHWSGLVPFTPQEWDYTFGSWIKLPNK